MRREGRVAPPARLAGAGFIVFIIMPAEQVPCQGICIVASAKLRAGGAPGLWRIATGGGRRVAFCPTPVLDRRVSGPAAGSV